MQNNGKPRVYRKGSKDSARLDFEMNAANIIIVSEYYLQLSFIKKELN